ncbi:MAG: CBS domain-containing protein [Caldilineaceae bacterium]
MLVRDRMSAPAITITANESFHKGLHVMQARKLRRLPVVDAENRLVGIVAERDLALAASHYLTAPVDVEEIMCKEVLTIGPDTSISEAAILMVDRRIGGLPVVDAEQHVLGIITESDIFRTFVDLVRQGATDDPNLVPSEMMWRF